MGRSRPAVIACRTVRSGVFHHWIHHLWPRGALPPALTLFGGVGFIARRLRRPEKGNADGVRGIFGTACRVGLRPCDWTHLKNGLCHIRTLVGRRINNGTWISLKLVSVILSVNSKLYHSSYTSKLESGEEYSSITTMWRKTDAILWYCLVLLLLCFRLVVIVQWRWNYIWLNSGYLRKIALAVVCFRSWKEQPVFKSFFYAENGRPG